MKKETAQRIFDIQEAAARDEDYRKLLEEYRERNVQMLRLLRNLPREQAEILEDYLGLVAEMHRRLLELACQS